ncbi:MAG: diguanylate cyclase [Actinomycetes bacterium]
MSDIERQSGSWKSAVFDAMSDIVIVIDSMGTIVYANANALLAVREQHNAVVGHSIADFLHPDELEMGLAIIESLLDVQLDVLAPPAVYRTRQSTGEWLPLEFSASSLPAPNEGHLLLVGRYSGDQDLQSRIMELLSASKSPTAIIGLLPELGLWRQPLEHYAVFFVDDDGSPRWVGTPTACKLGEAGGGDSPWDLAAERGVEVLVDVTDFPDALRVLAQESAMAECRAIPVADPLTGGSAVIVSWGRVDGSVSSSHRYALTTMARMLTLILAWRRNVTELERAAFTDGLTGLANRSGFWTALELISQLGPTERYAVMYVDLDGFKAVNDTYGHRFGDLVLSEVAQRIRAVVRPTDFVARLGGDEFAVLCLGVEDDAWATMIADRLVHSISQVFVNDDTAVMLGASVGIATALAGQAGVDELVESADQALYQAKASGRGCWHLTSWPLR